LRLSGFFTSVTAFIARRARGPLFLVGAIIATTGVLSAFLVNDAVCLMLAPLVIETMKRLGRRPLPYLLCLAMASNIGSVATITGNPQNIIIGSLSHIPYADFAAALAPVAAAGLVLAVAVLALAWRSEFLTRARLVGSVPRP